MAFEGVWATPSDAIFERYTLSCRGLPLEALNWKVTVANFLPQHENISYTIQHTALENPIHSLAKHHTVLFQKVMRNEKSRYSFSSFDVSYTFSFFRLCFSFHNRNVEYPAIAVVTAREPPRTSLRSNSNMFDVLE